MTKHCINHARKVKLYTNNKFIIGFTKKQKGFKNEYEGHNLGQTIENIWIDRKQLITALKYFKGHIKIKIKKNQYSKVLVLENKYKECYIARVLK